MKKLISSILAQGSIPSRRPVPAPAESGNRIPTTTVGLDLSNQKADYCTLNRQGQVIARGQVQLSYADLNRHFGHHRRARIALEVCGQSAWISELLEHLGHQVIVANAREVQSITRSQRKSDRRDAEQLARLARVDPELLHPIQHRRVQRRFDLMIIRGRAAVVECRTRLINSVRGTAKAFGEPVPAASSARFAERARKTLSPSLAGVLAPLLGQIESLTATIENYDEQIRQLSEKYKEEFDRVAQVPGVGPITAITFLLTLDSPERFAHSRDVGPYLGLVPARAQSGESDPDKRISKAGDCYLRKLLVQCSQQTLTRFGTPSAIRDWGLAQAARSRTAKKRAVVAVARRLAVLLHRLWQRGEVYRPYPQNPQIAGPEKTTQPAMAGQRKTA